jgi:hypothetical protein
MGIVCESLSYNRKSSGHVLELQCWFFVWNGINQYVTIFVYEEFDCAFTSAFGRIIYADQQLKSISPDWCNECVHALNRARARTQ